MSNINPPKDNYNNWHMTEEWKEWFSKEWTEINVVAKMKTNGNDVVLAISDLLNDENLINAKELDAKKQYEKGTRDGAIKELRHFIWTCEVFCQSAHLTALTPKELKQIAEQQLNKYYS